MNSQRTPPHIRRAAVDDAPAIASLAVQLGYPSSEEQIRHRLESITQRDDHQVLAAEIDGDLVGWIHVFEAQRVESDPSAEIGGLVVDTPARDLGIGTALLAAAENWAVDRGHQSIRARSNVIRGDAHRFYETLGYTRSKQQGVFDKPLAER